MSTSVISFTNRGVTCKQEMIGLQPLGYGHTAGESDSNLIFFFFDLNVTQICFDFDRLNSTSHIGHFHCSVNVAFVSIHKKRLVLVGAPYRLSDVIQLHFFYTHMLHPYFLSCSLSTLNFFSVVSYFLFVCCFVFMSMLFGLFWLLSFFFFCCVSKDWGEGENIKQNTRKSLSSFQICLAVWTTSNMK